MSGLGDVALFGFGALLLVLLATDPDTLARVCGAAVRGRARRTPAHPNTMTGAQPGGAPAQDASRAGAQVGEVCGLCPAGHAHDPAEGPCAHVDEGPFGTDTQCGCPGHTPTSAQFPHTPPAQSDRSPS